MTINTSIIIKLNFDSSDMFSRSFIILSILGLVTITSAHAMVEHFHFDLETSFTKPHVSTITWLFNTLFPFGPEANAILATAYISGPPNLLLAFIPADIDVSSLSVLVAFAVGGLLGDVFMHLLPETFTQNSFHLPNGKEVVAFDHVGNVKLGSGMFVGFFLFFFIDKLMRIIEGSEEADGNAHSHSHSLNPTEKESKAVIKHSAAAYLNLVSDFTHNITDGIAIAGAFRISHSVGCTTAVATFLHEVPHEVGDFALLVQGGFSTKQAMGAQFITAIGAFVGTFLGIYLGDVSSEGSFSTMTLPFTAGGFLYIAFSAVPELLTLQPNTTRLQNLFTFTKQIVAMAAGVLFMGFIAMNE